MCSKCTEQLGHGFLEKVYETALVAELNSRGLSAQSQASIRVEYKGQTIGQYFAHILVEDRIVIEIKAQPALHPTHAPQLLNYLSASKLHVGYLVNFHYPRASIQRSVQ